MRRRANSSKKPPEITSVMHKAELAYPIFWSKRIEDYCMKTDIPHFRSNDRRGSGVALLTR
jgi:hypothetical protein